MARRNPITEDLARLLCRMDEEDTALAIHGSLDYLPRRRHWDGIAEVLRDGYRRDAARIINHLRGKLGLVEEA